MKVYPYSVNYSIMKKTTSLLAILLLFLAVPLYAQVEDIGLYFKYPGYIQDISLADGTMHVNFKTKDAIKTHLVVMKDPATGSYPKGISNLNDLWTGLEIEVLGDQFMKKGYVVAKEIKISPRPQRVSIDGGIIVDIIDDFLIVDGYRVKLAPDGKIFGDRNKLYKGKVFKNFKQLKFGDFADVSGTYDTQGYILAREVKVSPNLDTEEDKMVRNLETVPEGIKKLLEDWDDPNSRKQYFGKTIDDHRGPIVNSVSLQNYVSELGNRLVPPALKEKMKFRFIVFNNREWNATAKDYGLVSIYTGLLNGVENEAQLAAVIGHEISHVLYKHEALSAASNRKTKKGLETTDQVNTTAASALNLFANWSDSPHLKNNEQGKLKFKSNTDSLSSAFSNLIKSRKHLNNSIYNQKQETESDRVGLYLMAKNGYPAIEAMKIWKKHLDGTIKPKVDNPNVEKSLEAINTFTNEFSNYKRPPSTTDIGLFVLKNTMQKKTIKNTGGTFSLDGSTITHPDSRKRFEDLNELAGLYYTPHSAGNSGNVNDRELENILLTARNESKIATEKQITEISSKYKTDYDREKKFKTQLIKFQTELSKKADVLLNYEDLKIHKLIKINDLVKTAKCKNPELLENLGEIHKKYESEIAAFVTSFKAGKYSGQEKMIKYSLYFCIARNFNVKMEEIAARIMTCDGSYLNGLNLEIYKNNFSNYIVPSQDALVMIYEHLASREEKKAEK
jgi:hypothetical protein